MRIYVGNVSYDTEEETLNNEFSAHGQVDEVAIVKDRETGRSRGFAFVTMPNDDEANNAIEAINGTAIDGRTLRVNEARPRNDNRGGNRSGGFNRQSNRF